MKIEELQPFHPSERFALPKDDTDLVRSIAADFKQLKPENAAKILWHEMNERFPQVASILDMTFLAMQLGIDEWYEYYQLGAGITYRTYQVAAQKYPYKPIVFAGFTEENYTDVINRIEQYGSDHDDICNAYRVALAQNTLLRSTLVQTFQEAFGVTSAELDENVQLRAIGAFIMLGAGNTEFIAQTIIHCNPVQPFELS